MKKKRTSVVSIKDDNLEHQAQTQLNSGHYKEAIALYKTLIRDGDNADYHQRLAHCYWLRALSFAARGMHKEALVLWENQSQHIQPPYEGYDHYISWLIIANNQTKIQPCLSQLSAQQLDKDFSELSVLLGLLMITEHPEFLQYLPQDSDIVSHLKIVQTALQAYQDEDLQGVNKALKQIPFRSAFRDFRTLLKAALAIPTSSSEAISLLAKIPSTSPYSATANLLLAIFVDGSVLVRELMQFNHKQIKTLAEIKGLNKKQFKLVEYLTRQKDQLSDKVKFNLAIQYQSLCGSEMAQHYCRALLATYPAGKRDYKKKFAALNEFEENRYQALACEQDHNGYDAEFYWRQCISLLSDEENDNDLKIALILRHVAQQSEPYEQIEYLIESLDHDSNDRESYLKILHLYDQEEDQDNYKLWLGKTIDKFPQEIDVLNLATQTAMANKTYKKAGQYAAKLLKLDPVNSFAKQVLASSHLAHARNLIKGKKFHLVEKEIKQAEKLQLGQSHTDQIQLIRGLLCFANQDKQQGLNEITEALKKLNADPVNSHFQATIEALLTGLPVATLLRELPSAKDHLLSKQALSQLIQKLKQYEQEDVNQKQLHKALEKVKPALKKSVQQQDYDESQILTLCQTLETIDHFELLRHCSKSIPIKWIKPIWAFYQIYSETNGNPEKCTTMQILRLEHFQETARQEKDHRAMLLITNFIEDYYRAFPQRNMGFLENLFNPDMDEDDFEDPLETLFGHIPEKIQTALSKQIESFSRKTSPEKLAEELLNETGKTEKIILAMMNNPDLFTALMLVKAANNLKIDIDVSYADVLEVFDVNKPNDSFPFPF